MDKEKELQKLLADERLRNEKWRKNYQLLKEWCKNLQINFLSSRAEIKNILKDTLAIKQVKEDEIENIKKILIDKDNRIEQLINDLSDKDKINLTNSQKLEENYEEKIYSIKKEISCYKNEEKKFETEIRKLKNKLENIENDYQLKIKDLELEQKNELENILKENEELKVQFKNSKKHPEYEKLVNLNKENLDLKNQIKELYSLLNEADSKYKKIDEEREIFISEQFLEKKNLEKKLEKILEELENQKKENSFLKSKSTINDNQLLQLKEEISNFQSSKDYLAKEHAIEVKRIIKEKLDLKKNLEEEKEQIEKESKKYKNDYEDSLNEIKKLQSLLENKEKEFNYELIKINKLEKEKILSFDKESKQLLNANEEIKNECKKLQEDLKFKQKQLDDLLNEKFNTEKETILLKAKVDNLHLSELELEKSKKQFDSLYDDYNKIRLENSELNALTKQLNRENLLLKDEFNIFRNDIQEEKKQFYEYKINTERNLDRFKNSFDLEKTALKEEIEDLKDVLRNEKRKRVDIKTKCVQYCEIAKKLHSQLKSFEKNEKNKLMIEPSKKELTNDVEPPIQKIHLNLKNQYKEMKKKLVEIQNSDFCKVHQHNS